MNPQLANKTIGQIIDDFHTHIKDPNEKGEKFEKLVIEVLEYLPEYEIKKAYRWKDWPDRKRIMQLNAKDLGIDLIAIQDDDKIIAIQCKCFKQASVTKKDVDSFLALSSQPEIFSQRWIVSTSEWTNNLVNQVQTLPPPIKRIDFLKHANEILPKKVKRQPHSLLLKQKEALDAVLRKFANHNRGRLIMACGTGKTFTSLCISEKIVENGGNILFVAPSIALVSQSRREWLKHKRRPLESLVICSDKSAGGKKESTRTYELACNVTTDSQEIAKFLKTNNGLTKVLFCTYQSLWSVIQAQEEYGAPEFSLTLCDEAHRTTGVNKSALKGKKRDFQAVHYDLRSVKRLYMTATERIYTAASKLALSTKGIEIIDMKDENIYGPLFYKLKFKDAIEQDMLCDYRIIAMGIREDYIWQGLRNQLIQLAEEDAIDSRTKKPLIITNEDLLRILGTSLAINGVVEGANIETPEQLYRNIVFANSITRSKFYARALSNAQLKSFITHHKKEGKALKTEVKHLDASHSSHIRLLELDRLNEAKNENTARILCNVGLFGEGIDVPTLDAITFIEPKKSQIDIIQAVGRIMRKPKDTDKKLGYIIIPVPIKKDQELQDALSEHGYEAIGQVLRALQSHDERLAENVAQFLTIVSVEGPTNGGSNGAPPIDTPLKQLQLDWQEVDKAIYSQLVTASGLGKAGKLITDEIAREIDQTAKILMSGREEVLVNTDFIDGLAQAMGIKIDNNEFDICKIATLLISNACLLQKRLQSLEKWQVQLEDMLEIAGAGINSIDLLTQSWQTILNQDYKPVFIPALAVVRALPRRPFVAVIIRRLAECAENVADELTSLGYDHAGPLYHKIMPKAEAKGAFYTNNISALILAKLTIDDNWIDWHDDYAIQKLKIMDPACGTGTLLMATIKVIKEQFIQSRRLNPTNPIHQQQLTDLHKTLVENVIYGLDINQCAIQLTASNLTLGAPNVDYRKMNLHTLKHGLQPDSTIRAGSLEILNESYPGKQLCIDFIQSSETENTQVNDEDITFPTSNINLVIMNPPFTNNVKRSSQYSNEDKKRMQAHERSIRNAVEMIDKEAEGLIDSNSISTFFTPLADKLLHKSLGVLAKVMPTTACIGASGISERQFLAKRFHIECIIASHDPKRPNFSENTGIHESLFIGRRYNGDNNNNPTDFISLKRMPQNEEEVNDLIESIKNPALENKWLMRRLWPTNLVKQGDWTPAQWLNNELAEIAQSIKSNQNLEPISDRYKIGPVGRSVRGIYKECSLNDAGAKPLFWSISSKIRTQLLSEPESWRCPKSGKHNLAEKCWQNRNNVLVAQKMNTVANYLTAVWSETASIGSLFMPINIKDENLGKGFVAWWNSTPAMIMLLNLRSGMLTYPSWSQDQLYSIGIPKPNNPAWSDLTKAFEQIKNKEILTLKDGERCEVRHIIDKAAAKALDIPEEYIAKWRAMLAKEPTISNQYAT